MNDITPVHILSDEEIRKKRQQLYQYMNKKFDQKLALNIANPTARVQTISRIKIDSDTEDKLIEKFIGQTDDDPTGCTAAMQGRPVVFRVQMKLANQEILPIKPPYLKL